MSLGVIDYTFFLYSDLGRTYNGSGIQVLFLGLKHAFSLETQTVTKPCKSFSLVYTGLQTTCKVNITNGGLIKDNLW
jgi:hypothetical protein